MHYQPKEWQVNYKSLLHERTSVYEEYIECILVSVIRIPEFKKTNWGLLGKRKFGMQKLKQDFETKLARKTVW